MRFYERLRRKRLSDLLIDEKVATKDAVIAALEEHKHSRRMLSEVLLKGNELTEYDLARVLVAQYQLPFVDLGNYNFHKDLIKNYPAELLHRAGVIPLDQFGETVGFACQEFPSEEIAAELESHGPAKIFYFVALALEIKQALHDNVPLEQDADVPFQEEPAAPVTEGAPAEANAPSPRDESSWTELFDMANESVLEGIQDGADLVELVEDGLDVVEAEVHPDELPSTPDEDPVEGENGADEEPG